MSDVTALKAQEAVRREVRLGGTVSEAQIGRVVRIGAQGAALDKHGIPITYVNPVPALLRMPFTFVAGLFFPR